MNEIAFAEPFDALRLTKGMPTYRIASDEIRAPDLRRVPISWRRGDFSESVAYASFQTVLKK